MRKTAIGGLMMMLSILVGSLTVWAAGNTYINGIDANFPPFAYVNQSGQPEGLDVDAINWIAKKMGFQVKHQPMDWDGIIPSLNAKKIDFIASGMTITE
ncbi:MAG: transporter substrate-binding domain-containing protein, partial [Deltaproteobacteria bacterium]|nr:transporter substrate-binding domain-containing protein [Deltaproteobacteria bacterium]